MKKIILIIFIFILIFTFSSCKKKEKNKETDDVIVIPPDDNPPEGGGQTNPPEGGNVEPPINTNKLLLGEYSKGLDYLDDFVGEAVIEAVHRYINANASISKLSTIDITTADTNEVKALLDEALDNWEGVLEIAAIADYLEGLEIEKLEQEVKHLERNKIDNRGIYNETDPVKWAEAITQKYDSIKGNHKLQELSNFMGTDAKTAYKTLEVAQNILQGEYAKEEGKAEEWIAILEATKTASKVGVFLCGTTLTCGTSALSPAGYLTYGEATGILIGGVDCCLTIGSQGANIILGEDNKTAKKIANISDIYSKASFVYGIFNSPDSVGEKIAFVGDCIENLNSTVSYFFKVDPLGDGGQLVTKVIDNSLDNITSADIAEIGLGSAYDFVKDEKELDIDSFILNNKSNIVGDDLTLKLQLDDVKDEVVKEFDKTIPDPLPNASIADNGVLLKEDSYNGYRYRNLDGYLDGQQIQYHYGKYGQYICMKKTYDNGVCVKYQQFYEDSTIQSNGYYMEESGQWVWEYYDDGYYSGHVKGALDRVVYHDVSLPTTDELKESIIDGYELKYYDSKTREIEIVYDQNTGLPTSQKIKSGDGTSRTESYKYVEGEMYVQSIAEQDLDGTYRIYGYYSDGLKSYISVQYPDGSSDKEDYTYGVDDDGVYVKIDYYTNYNLVNTSIIRAGEEGFPTSFIDDNPPEEEGSNNEEGGGQEEGGTGEEQETSPEEIEEEIIEEIIEE